MYQRLGVQLEEKVWSFPCFKLLRLVYLKVLVNISSKVFLISAVYFPRRFMVDLCVIFC